MPDTLRIIPLGGVGEVGKNITAIEAAGEILVVDCGLAFPEQEMLGIDLVIPDVTYLRENRDRVKAAPPRPIESIVHQFAQVVATAVHPGGGQSSNANLATQAFNGVP